MTSILDLVDVLRAQWSGEFDLCNGKIVVAIEEANGSRVLAELREMLDPFGWAPGRTVAHSFDRSKRFVVLEESQS